MVGTNLSHCQVYGISVWDIISDERTCQDSLVITKAGEPQVLVDDLEIAQFIHLLLNHQKLRNVLNALTQRGVLLLGRFSQGGIEDLYVIAAELRKFKYLPIIFDFVRPDAESYTQTIKILVGLSRFVIVDLSGPSVPQEMYATVPHFLIPFIPIIKAGLKPNSMFKDFLEYPHVLKPLEYQGIQHLAGNVENMIIRPAEAHVREREARLKAIFG